MKMHVYGLDGASKGQIEIKLSLNEPIRQDLIQRAVESEDSRRRQPYGTDPMAGKRTSAHYHGERGVYMSMMNKEIARNPRIHGNAGHLSFVARFSPHATKGRRAHPPKAEKVFGKKINSKEYRKALIHAVFASFEREIVSSRGHIVSEVKNLPLIVSDEMERIGKVKDMMNFLEKMGLEKEMERVSEKKRRAGRGKMRNRRWRQKKGPLIVASKTENVRRAAENIAGVEVCDVKGLTVSLLAPGTHAGRLVVWTESAVKGLEKRLAG
ncbi:MAG: 50S ribosomal protein L4 [Candidatus Aenigmarchaeota archaeon]|nr:50S ribosomal protein L4 [Candidatus Aenigmarchaeota archaeon]